MFACSYPYFFDPPPPLLLLLSCSSSPAPPLLPVHSPTSATTTLVKPGEVSVQIGEKRGGRHQQNEIERPLHAGTGVVNLGRLLHQRARHLVGLFVQHRHHHRHVVRRRVPVGLQYVSLPERLPSQRRRPVREVLMIHVGGTRCVTWSIDRIVQRHACITWGVELILAIFFIFFFYV